MTIHLRKFTTKHKVAWKQLKIATVIFVLEFILSAVIIFSLGLNLIKVPLDQKIQRVHEDVHFTKSTWDISTYITDPLLLGESPLYLITSDGLVLDRRSLIHGFLDTSDYKYLLSYDHPKTVTTVPNQTRRIYAQPIVSNNVTIGVIAVSYFNPRPEFIKNIDKQLAWTMQDISTKIKVNKGTIDANAIDDRAIPFNISFTIVDKYNTIIRKTANVSSIARIPTFIDRSYVKAQLNAPQETLIRDNQTGQFFIVKTDPLKDSRGIVAGVVSAGLNIQPLLTFLRVYFFVEGILGFVLMLVCFLLFPLLLGDKKQNQQPLLPAHIIFNEMTGILTIDKRKIAIPYATNQFYLLQALFHKPTKRWETDELLKRFGEDNGIANGRKVYDTMIKINKKVATVTSVKLILNQHKTYQLNPEIVDLL